MRFSTILITLVLLWPLGAAAQTVPEEGDVIRVSERPDPDFDPLGIPVRSFLFHPSLQIREEYNDNIFAADTAEESDMITNIRPALAAQSNWDLHMLRFFTGADIGVHADNTSENFEDYRVGVAGRYDLDYATFVDAGLRYVRTHEERSSIDDSGGDEPTEIDIVTGELGFTRALGRLKLFTHARVRDIEYENAFAGSNVIDNSFRNRTHNEFETKLAYEHIPNYDSFISVIYDRRDYETTPFADRSSQGYRLRAGTQVNISGKVKGEIYGGYIAQDYDAAFEDVSAADFGASLLWNVSALTSLIAKLDRELIETTGAQASGYIRTLGTFTAEHAFTDNILAAFELTYADDDFIGISRGDETRGIAFDLGYKPLRGFESVIRYDYRERESDALGQDFDNHRLMLRLGYTF